MFSPMNGQFWTYQAYREEVERTARRYQLIRAAMEGRLEPMNLRKAALRRMPARQGPGFEWRVKNTTKVLWNELVDTVKSLPQVVSRSLFSNRYLKSR